MLMGACNMTVRVSPRPTRSAAASPVGALDHFSVRAGADAVVSRTTLTVLPTVSAPPTQTNPRPTSIGRHRRQSEHEEALLSTGT